MKAGYRQLSRQQLLRTASVLLLTLAFVSGCVQQYPIPNAARTGDTLVLGLGGIQRNALANQSLQPSDLQIVLTDHAGTPFTLTAENIFKGYPDYASELNYAAIEGQVPLAPFDGGWFVTVPLRWTDAAHTGGIFPLPLAIGTGSVAITSNKLTNTLHPTEGDLTNIPVEILPGTADANKNLGYAQQFISYESRHVLKISPPNNLTINLTGNTTVWGLQLAITYPQALTYLDANHPPMILPYSHNPYIQLSQNIVANSNGTNTLMVLLTTQNGFTTPAKQTALTPLLSDLPLRLMYFVASNQGEPDPATVLNDFHIEPTKSFYLNTDGGLMVLQKPVLSHE